jgi:membrane peptidoglycan carboxypeptidase
VLYDTQGALPGYPCTNKQDPKQGGNCLQNYDFKYPGPLTLRYALGGSRNVPAVKSMLSSVPNDKSNGRVDSINKTISTASDMMANKYYQAKKTKPYNCYADEALTQTTQCYGAAAIGDGAFLHLDDHVNGLATLGRMGKAIPRTYIMKITDASHKTLYEWKQPQGKQAIKPDAAYIVNDMASDPKASYLPAGYKFHRYKGWNFAVKTGTTNDGYDGLMTSWSTKYAVVSWVGHHTRRVTLRSSMESLTAPMTRGFMEFAHANEKPVNWTQPATIKTAPAFVVRNHVGIGSVEPSPTNDIYPSWYVGGGAAKNSSQTIDRVSNKLATNCTPPLAKNVAANANAASWNIDIFNGGRTSVNTGGSGTGSTGSQPTDDVHNCNDSPPTVTLTTPTACDTSSCTITAVVTQGTHPLNDPQYAQFPGTVNFTLNGQVIHTQHVADSPSTVSFSYTPTSSGSGTLTVTVVDSVLYQGTNSATLTYTGPPVTAGRTNENTGNNNGTN